MNKEIENQIHDQNKMIDVKMVVEDAFNKGLNDAWECVRKITADKPMAGWVTLCAFFGVERNDFCEIFKKYSASEAIEMLERYEDKMEIKVGDEVFVRNTYDIKEGENCRMVVYCISDKGYISAFNATATAYVEREKCTKTGRHFPQISEVLKALEKIKKEGTR